MQVIRHKNERGATKIDWLDSRHSFSFGDYRDPANMGFGPLRVINEDFIAPDSGFGTHGHANMEIMTYILSGAIEHKDSLGNGSVIRPGDIQLMSAGSGIMHSEFNPAPDEGVHLLQIWIMPDSHGTRPGYQQTRFDGEEMHNKLRLVVSPDGAAGSLKIRQEARVYVSRLDAGKEIALPMQADRLYWVQVARGAVAVEDKKLSAGDAIGFENEASGATLLADEAAEILFFDLPQ
jgi:redox-sensitive bicupin YhaK (pirin superfamily)